VGGVPISPSIPEQGWCDPPQAMSGKYQGDDGVDAYRRYSLAKKAVFAGKGPAT
jgi:hypothetical protein